MKQKWLQRYSILALVVACSLSVRADNKTEWMKSLHDTIPLCKISISGTHDSGATRGGCMVKTQRINITEQLERGIRAFDIRLKRRGDKLGLYHSFVFQGTYWEEDILPTFIRFLQEHPSETLIVSLKKEGGEHSDYASLLSTSLRDSIYQPYFVFDFNPSLTLEDCRGKILFLHRTPMMDDYPGVACIGWADNKTTQLTLRNKDGREGYAFLQDEYQYKSHKEAEKKVKACITNFENIAAEPAISFRWGISFVSATGLPFGTPAAFAKRVNEPVANYLIQANAKHCGIVFIDFIETPEGQKLVAYLIDSNF